jgi:hypothetical protein
VAEEERAEQTETQEEILLLLEPLPLSYWRLEELEAVEQQEGEQVEQAAQVVQERPQFIAVETERLVTEQLTKEVVVAVEPVLQQTEVRHQEQAGDLEAQEMLTSLEAQEVPEQTPLRATREPQLFSEAEARGPDRHRALYQEEREETAW